MHYSQRKSPLTQILHKTHYNMNVCVFLSVLTSRRVFLLVFKCTVSVNTLGCKKYVFFFLEENMNVPHNRHPVPKALINFLFVIDLLQDRALNSIHFMYIRLHVSQNTVQCIIAKRKVLQQRSYTIQSTMRMHACSSLW